MTTLSDPFWQAAAEAALAALAEAEHVLVPHEFLALHERFAPLEFSWGLRDQRRLAWCCSKDDVDRVAPWLNERAADAAYFTWANEVFVLGGNFRWARAADDESLRHLPAWFERVSVYRGGTPVRPTKERPAGRMAAGQDSHARRVLVVGASNMGNVGDDLLAGVLADLLAEMGAEAYLSGPDIDPLHVAAYDAVVVGGGGLLYASRDGANETQNLANYLKFGPIGRHCNVPVGLIGVGDQDHAGGVARDPLTQRFLRTALTQFAQVTTRDPLSSEFLERWGAKNLRTGCDLLLCRAERMRAAVRPTVVPPDRIALVGELYRHAAFAEGLGDGEGELKERVRDGDFDLLVMSEDDIPHAQRAQKALQKAGAAAAVVDLRGRDVDELVFVFGSYAGVLTTRFHGLLLALMVGVPVVALDVREGKSARLLTDLGVDDALLIEAGSADATERLGDALEGKLAPVPAGAVEALAERVAVHRDSLRSLLGVQNAKCPAVGTEKPATSPRIAAGAVRAPLGEAETIPLCWAASSEHTEGAANLGDSLSAVIVAALANRAVRHADFTDLGTKLVAVGSIGHAISGGTAVVWGTGVSIRGGVLARNVPRTRYDICAVRGSISAQHFRDFGIAVPDVFGDPVWFLPSVVDEPVEKKYELGVIPHIRDVSGHDPAAPARADSLRCAVDGADASSVVVINTWHEPTWDGLLAKLRLIRSCKRIASQSFHGVVIAEAYGIPVLNFRHLLGAKKDGPVQVDLTAPCQTDPRIWEFYKGGPRPYFHSYSQRRGERTPWDAVIRSIDERWEPFAYDARPLAEAFPLPLAYDPMTEIAPSLRHVAALEF